MEQAFAKRLLDLVLSLILLVIASPFMLIIALLVKLYDGGPILYKQERLTIGGKKFMIFKFRSMKMDSEKHGARLAMKNDD
ncbi:exopolysaccharide biosynthesis polyprenyl glycosylphosphotransferase, partial [Lachnotalea glycerini]